jgi:hypothetical protein
MPESAPPKAWDAWYAFARVRLGLLHEECVEYANLRFVEEQNRASLKERGVQPVPAAPIEAPEVRPHRAA